MFYFKFLNTFDFRILTYSLVDIIYTGKLYETLHIWSYMLPADRLFNLLPGAQLDSLSSFICFIDIIYFVAPVAQLDRATDF